MFLELRPSIYGFQVELYLDTSVSRLINMEPSELLLHLRLSEPVTSESVKET